MLDTQILEQIKKGQHVLIAAHVNPDGDALGSMTGLGHLLKALDIPFTLLLKDYSPKLEYLLEDLPIQQGYDGFYDLFITLDCGDEKRLGDFEPLFQKAKVTINIDHHYTNTYFGTYNFVDDQASSTCEMVYRLYKASTVKANLALAQALYTGLVTDTGGFMHGCTSGDTLRAAADLIETGFDFSSLYHKLIHEKTRKAMYMDRTAIEHMVIDEIRGIYLTYITQDDLKRYDASKHDIEGVIHTVRSIEGCKIAALLYPLGEKTYKLSVRSIDPYNVAEVCQSFGGGGHQRAAGATLEGNLEDLLLKVKKALEISVEEG